MQDSPQDSKACPWFPFAAMVDRYFVFSKSASQFGARDQISKDWQYKFFMPSLLSMRQLAPPSNG
jgi:hypothetical protein